MHASQNTEQRFLAVLEDEHVSDREQDGHKDAHKTYIEALCTLVSLTVLPVPVALVLRLGWRFKALEGFLKPEAVNTAALVAWFGALC